MWFQMTAASSRIHAVIWITTINKKKVTVLNQNDRTKQSNISRTIRHVVKWNDNELIYTAHTMNTQCSQYIEAKAVGGSIRYNGVASNLSHAYVITLTLITHPCPNFRGGLDKVHGRVITFRRHLWMLSITTVYVIKFGDIWRTENTGSTQYCNEGSPYIQ